MKPNFALNLTHENIGLLHRTARGWLEVGAAALDDPDMGEALNYLRRSALGLAPHGVATKLVIPNSQLLYFEVAAPGPDNAYRRAQIRRALEGRTPYALEELVFDWSGDGPMVKVAACARETLAEAEQFAAQYKFNPVSFVAIPEAGQFDGEPWFGPTSIAAQILPQGETVERDEDAVRVITRDPVRAEAPRAPAAAEPAPDTQSYDAVDDFSAEAFAPEDFEAHDFAAEATLDVAPAPDLESYAAPEATDPAPAAALPPNQMSFADVLNDHIVEPEDVAEPAPAPAKPKIEVTVNAAAFSSRRLPEVDDDLPPKAPAAVMGLRAKTTRSEPAVSVRLARITPVNPTTLAAQADDAASDDTAAFNPKSVAAQLGLAAKAQAAPSPSEPKAALAAPLAALAKAKVKAKAKELKALVSAPGLAGIAKSRAKTLIAPPPATTTAANTIAPRGKMAPREATPKYLGLILTAILLVFLLVVAIWSSYTVVGMIWGEDTVVATAPLEAEPTPASGETGAQTSVITAPSGVDLAIDAPPADAAPLESGAPAVAAVAPTDLGAAAAQDEILLSGVDVPPAAGDAAAPPQVSAGADALPDAGLPPPPFGTQYEFEPNGQVKPTAAGVITPDGVRVIAGRPPVVPRARPASLVPPAATPDLTPDAAPLAANIPPDGVTAVGADPALAGFRPQARPAGMTVAPAQPVPAASASLMPQDTALPADGVTAVGADPALSGFRPKARPAGLTPPDVEGTAPLAVAADPRLAAARPRARPATVAALGEAARAATAAASLSASAAVPAEPQTEVQISPTAVAISRKPLARPRSFARAVEAAVAAAVRPVEVQPEPEPEQVAAAKPAPLVKPAKPVKPAPVAKPLKPTAPEADDEPEITAKAPSSPSKGVVAKQATFANAINLSKTNLIGVYGTSSKRYALIRTPQGRYKKVKVGDTVDGGKVAAILDSELRYQKGGRMLALTMPKG